MNGAITSFESHGNTMTLADVIEHGFEQLQKCDGCGQARPDVDRWAENDETGEVIRLCLECGDR